MQNKLTYSSTIQSGAFLICKAFDKGHSDIFVDKIEDYGHIGGFRKC